MSFHFWVDRNSVFSWLLRGFSWELSQTCPHCRDASKQRNGRNESNLSQRVAMCRKNNIRVIVVSRIWNNWKPESRWGWASCVQCWYFRMIVPLPRKDPSHTHTHTHNKRCPMKVWIRRKGPWEEKGKMLFPNSTRITHYDSWKYLRIPSGNKSWILPIFMNNDVFWRASDKLKQPKSSL